MRFGQHDVARKAILAASAALVAAMVTTGSPAWAAGEHGTQVDPLGWAKGHQIAEIDAPGQDGFFGSSVTLSGDGSTVVVGSFYENNGAGAVYVYTKSHGTWVQNGPITGKDTAAGDYFGTNVAVSRNGSLVVVGAWGHADQTGSAYVFRLRNGTYKQVAEFTDPDGVPGDGLGTGLALTPTGSTIVVGANGDNDYAGAAYVYTQHGRKWTQTGKLTASDASEDASLGSTMAISADGSTVLVGAYLGDDYHGAAYVFTNSGGTWSQTTEWKSPVGSGVPHFGWSVALSADASTAVVSANYENSDAGGLYVYTQSGGAWSQTAAFAGNDTAAGDQFGTQVSINAKGNTIVAGSISHDNGRGAMYVFKGSGSNWSQQAELTSSDPQEGDYLGAACAISADGSTIIGGAWGRDGGNGSVYLFKK